MHPTAIILILISVAYVRSDITIPEEMEVFKMPSNFSGDTYFDQNNDSLPYSDVYPTSNPDDTYSEYINNTNSLTEKNENHSTSEMIVQTPRTAVQATSQWSFQNIVSSLISFAKNLHIYGSLIGNFVMRFWIVIFVGTISTGVICMYTSICKFPGIEIKELASTYISSSNLNYLNTMILGALDKYRSTQEDEAETETVPNIYSSSQEDEAETETVPNIYSSSQEDEAETETVPNIYSSSQKDKAKTKTVPKKYSSTQKDKAKTKTVPKKYSSTQKVKAKTKIVLNKIAKFKQNKKQKQNAKAKSKKFH